jgi:hypothetical protein
MVENLIKKISVDCLKIAKTLGYVASPFLTDFFLTIKSEEKVDWSLTKLKVGGFSILGLFSFTGSLIASNNPTFYVYNDTYSPQITKVIKEHSNQTISYNEYVDRDSQFSNYLESDPKKSLSASLLFPILPIYLSLQDSGNNHLVAQKIVIDETHKFSWEGFEENIQERNLSCTFKRVSQDQNPSFGNKLNEYNLSKVLFNGEKVPLIDSSNVEGLNLEQLCLDSFRREIKLF